MKASKVGPPPWKIARSELFGAAGNSRKPGQSSAFSRTDLLFTAAALLLLLLVICKSNAGWREPGKQTLCANNLRQLAASLLMFATENDDVFPPRFSPAWTTSLLPFYRD